MSLKDDKQQNIQIELDFSSAPTGEAREAGREGPEAFGATSGTENPASTNRLMEAVCERENLKAALRQVKANKGSPGVDGMTVVGIKDYLKQHWPAIREQLLNGTYEPKPVRRVEIHERRPVSRVCTLFQYAHRDLSRGLRNWSGTCSRRTPRIPSLYR